MPGTYKDLRVWKQAMNLTVHVYKATEEFPKREWYGLTNQMRRAAVSVASNIAEGKGHRSDLEFQHFLYHARGSLLELETQIHLSVELKYIAEENGRKLLDMTASLAQGLNALINSLTPPKARKAAGAGE